MRSRRRLLEKSRLYVLIDRNRVKGPVLNIARKLAKSGVGIIQLRDKISSSKEILKEALLISGLLKGTRTLFIVNDYPDIAKVSKSDGLHIGQLDIPVKEARKIVGRDKIIGVSCMNLKQAQKAQRDGADYIGVGPLFKTKTKSNARPIGLKSLKEITRRVRLPIFAIGNINQDCLGEVSACGIKRIAVCQAVLKAKDISLAAKLLSTKLNRIK